MTFDTFTPEMVVDLVLQVFTGAEEPTPALVEQKVAEILVGPFALLSSQRDLIVNKILERIQVRIGVASTLDDDDDNHTHWLHEHDRSNWRFWPRLNRYLQRIDQFPPSVLQELDRSTDQTLERLESPDRAGTWNRRGLVVGHVQSGKTTHYTSLAAKALDAGYQIVIILAGIHNSLRSQTHERLDNHLIGRNSAALIDAIRNGNLTGTTGLVGVGKEDRLQGEPPLPVTILTCTTSADNGDFKKGIANQIGFQVSPGSRLVMVVKKNGSILRNLISWLRLQNAAGQAKITAPALIIDDEADHASVNTSRDPDDDPTTINKSIRKLLMSFERIGFVGYTATPFANIFINMDADHQEYGPDLFPRSFIVNLKAPSDYVGPNRVFGHSGDESAGIAEQPPLPMFEKIDDASSWLPDKHNKYTIPGQIPESLREAIRAFALVCAARGARGNINVHNSMLVHATRFVNVQERIAEQLTSELTALRNLISSASEKRVEQTHGELRQLWQRLFSEPHEHFRSRLNDMCPELPTWDEVWACLPDTVKRIEIMRINGDSTDALAYSSKPNGISVIAVGGDKLSRGLTLEGLSISYFLRATNMFDTLLQMGRWFGYRKGYVDLCRVYSTENLHNRFREVALAFDDLRADLERMAYAGKTPLDFGLRVRTPSDGLLITAANKIRRGEKVDVRFADTILQVLEMPRTGELAAQMREATEKFIAENGPWDRAVRGQDSPHFIWRGTQNVSKILEYLEQYEATSTPSFNNRCEAIRRYIGEQVKHDELMDWTVAIISKRDPQRKNQIIIKDGLSIPLVERAKSKPEAWNKELFATRGLTGSLDEAVDLSKEEFEQARRMSEPDPNSSDGMPKNPGRDEVREARPPRRGLLLMYLIQDQSEQDHVDFIPAIAISFPESTTAKPLAYTVNDVWKQQFGLLPEEDWDE